MYVVLLKFGENKSRAGDFMQDHNAWIRQGLEIKPGKADPRLEFLLA